MKVLMTGGAGFLGTRLARRLLAQGELCQRPIESLVLTDRVEHADPLISHDPRVRLHTGDLLNSLPELMQAPYDAVFHLASAVSAECEADFAMGLRANVHTTQALLEQLGHQAQATGVASRFFFSSSVAVFGGDLGLPMPHVVTDHTLPVPQSSYGIHKFVCEQLIADYTRKGFLDGRVARLMTVSVRAGRPNGAASGFLSAIIREPLAGQACVCPVDPDLRVALASPDKTIDGILAVFQADRDALGGRTAINLPALTVSVGEMLGALEDIAGPETALLVQFEPDPVIEQIVGSWPAQFDCERTRALGLVGDASFEDIINQYIDSLA
jgi:nucleoside-diphosphate-sugar epimerase